MSKRAESIAHRHYVKRLTDLRKLLNGIADGKTVEDIAKRESLDVEYLKVFVYQWKLD